LLAREKKIQRTSQSSLPFRLLLPYFPLPLLDFLVADPVQLPIVNSPTCVTQATATHARSLGPWPISIFPNRPQSFAQLPGKGRWEKAKLAWSLMLTYTWIAWTPRDRRLPPPCSIAAEAAW
jgi:hypothetical protein